MNDPRIISAISIIFLLVGAFNLYSGNRRIRDASRAGQRIRWYKQISILAGVEYILLSFIFLLSLTSQQNPANSSRRDIIVPIYLFLLVLAAIVAGLVIRQGLLNVRAARSRQGTIAPAVQAVTGVSESVIGEEKQSQRQRQRRKNAAAARRRRAGKA
jgi:hypothetical protein